MVRRLLQSIGVVLPLVITGTAARAAWPERPIKLVVPYPPGGVSDALARQVAHMIEKDLGQPIVVENKPGAGSNIGSEIVAKAKPDGYTILLASSANVLNMYLYKSLPYNTFKDFQPVSLLADAPNVLVVNSGFSAKNVQELIALAKEKPDGVAYASAGYGSPAHLSAELFDLQAHVKMRHIPYKGAGPAMADVMAGHVPVMFTNIAAVLPGVQAGKIRVLATGGIARWKDFPQVPTVAESGLPGYEAGAWYGLALPAATPAEIAERLQKALNAARGPAAKEEILKLGAIPVVSDAAALKARIESERAQYEKLVKDADLKVE